MLQQVIEEQVLPGLKLLILESGGIQVDSSFKTMVQSMIQDMKNNIAVNEKELHTANTKTGTTSQHAINQDNTSNNTSNSNAESSILTNPNNPATNSDKSTRKNLFEKLDAAASITAASITSSLKVDFDKAIPKWTWKNK